MERSRISHARALASGLLVFVYFCFTTAWLPSFMLRSSLLANAPRSIADGIALAAWGAFFSAGLGALRLAQKRGLI